MTDTFDAKRWVTDVLASATQPAGLDIALCVYARCAIKVQAAKRVDADLAHEIQEANRVLQGLKLEESRSEELYDNAAAILQALTRERV